MVKKKNFVISLAVFVLGLLFLNLFTVYFFGVPLSPVVMTGKVVETTGFVRIYVEGEPKVITISSPENTTYDFDKGDTYWIDLNVSADFFVENSSAWKYSLYDLKHNNYIYEDIFFTPNTSVAFVRWGNVLTVFSEEEDADWVNNSVVFTVDIPNSAPLIQNFSKKIFVCETDRVNGLDESHFNVYDIDEEEFNIPGYSYGMSGDPFAIVPSVKTSNYISPLNIVSAYFGKEHVGNYIRTVTVKDSDGEVDTNVTNITVIEINNAPAISPKLTAKTIWMSGPNSVFSYQMSVNDEEDGSSDDGNLTFSLTWGNSEDLFGVNVSTGVMYYVPQEGDQGPSSSKTYALTSCVSDNALSSVHENFSICSGRGHSSDSLSDCDYFTLTITNANRAPSIDSHSPSMLSYSVFGTTANVFSVTVSDDDMSDGFYPSINWYVDGVLVKEVEDEVTDSYSYTFGCGVSGVHNVTIVTSDGEFNDSLMWTIDVTNVDCPVTVGGGSSGTGGGGGGSFGGICNEQWSCLGWGLCQNAERSFDAGVLSPEDYSSTRDLCGQNLFDDRFCGFQITNCFDLEACNNSEFRVPKPSESRVCYFTENPNCVDGITNCHDGDCELLVDCGGPCEPCPTCSDGDRNQGEKGVDCGGPCPFACESESPFGAISFALIGLVLLLLLIVLYILYKVFNIVRHRFFLSKKRKR